MITIEPARTEHVEEIVNLWRSLMDIHKKIDFDFFKKTDSRDDAYGDDINRIIKNNSSDEKVFVAVVNSKVVGYISFEINYKCFEYYCQIGDLFVVSEYRKMGIGTLLIEEAKKGAKKHELSKVVLEVFNENQQSYTYFKSIGFNDMIQRMVLKI